MKLGHLSNQPRTPHFFDLMMCLPSSILYRYKYFPNEVQTGGFGAPPTRRQPGGAGGRGAGGEHVWGGAGRRLDD